jgi:CheY-like chemotaxis protein
MDSKEPLATNALPKLEKWTSARELSRDMVGRKETEAAIKEFLVLVVDDSIDNVTVISLDLQSEGYKVVTASNGEEAVTVAALTHPHIILMDISMPLMDGFAATRKIRENETLRDVPVIAITAYGTEGFQRAAYDVGIEGFLVKPIDSKQMHQLMRRLLAPKGAASGDLTSNPTPR